MQRVEPHHWQNVHSSNAAIYPIECDEILRCGRLLQPLVLLRYAGYSELKEGMFNGYHTVCGRIISMVGKQVTNRIWIKQPSSRARPGRNTNHHHHLMALGEQQSYIHPIGFGRNFLYYIRNLQGLCQDLLHPCESRIRDRKEPGWRNLPSYLSLVLAFPF